jgi:hypothetical protein
MLGGVEKIAADVEMPWPQEQRFRQHPRGAEAGAMAFKRASAKAKDRQKQQGWKEVGNKQGTRIVRQKMPGSDVQCIVATAEMKASPGIVYDLLADTERISEYNEYFDEYDRMQQLGAQAEIGWTSYKPVFPTSPREFVALCAWRAPGQLSFLEEARERQEEEEHGQRGPVVGSGKWWLIASKTVTPAQNPVVGPPRKGYTRGTIECAGYIMRWSPAFIEENGGVVPVEIRVDADANTRPNATGKKQAYYQLKGVKPGVQPRILFTSICQSSPGGSVPLTLVNSLAATAPYKVIKSIKAIAER